MRFMAARLRCAGVSEAAPIFAALLDLMWLVGSTSRCKDVRSSMDESGTPRYSLHGPSLSLCSAQLSRNSRSFR